MLVKNAILILLLSTFVFANKKYCTNISDKQRITSIYLDISNTSNKKFALDILSELQNNFLPHERLQIFTINPEEVTIKQVYNSCVPKLSLNEIKKIKEEGSLKYILGGNPIENSKEDYSFFKAELKNTLAKIYKSSINKDNEKKELVELLYSESASFQRKELQRVIIFSDMNQNSKQLPITQIFNDELISNKIIKEYKINFNYAEFYIYTGKKNYGITKHKKLINFWKNYIELNNGHIKYFNDSLILPKYKYQISEVFEGELLVNNKKYLAKLLLNYNERKEINNSWFIINEIEAIPLEGKVNLINGKLTRAQLTVSSINKKNHSLFIGDEKIILNFNNNKLKGEVRIDNADVILNGKTIKNPTFGIKMKKVVQ